MNNLLQGEGKEDSVIECRGEEEEGERERERKKERKRKRAPPAQGYRKRR